MDAVKQLENTAEVLRILMEGLSEGDAAWKPAPDRFSVAEVLEHLSHVEGHCFRARLDASLARDGAAWESYDTDAYVAAHQYAGRDPEDSFAHFEDQRDDNLELLRSLEEGWRERTGAHPLLGTVTLGELVNEWAFHDLGHIRQIVELVRARSFYPGMGPFQSQYKINP